MGDSTPRNVSIFVSSTFVDMQAERDALRDVVLPRLREFGARYGVSIDIVDLRWGIDTSRLDEGAQDSKILRSCMAEIDRCRPFFLVMLGDRYGYAPPDSEDRRSVTEREIDHALRRGVGEDGLLCYFRSIANPDAIADAERNAFFGSPDSRTRLASLKSRLSDEHPEAVNKYSVTIRGDGGYDLSSFCEQVVRDIEMRLSRQWGPLPKRGRASMLREGASQWRYAEETAATFVGRSRQVADLTRRCLAGGGARLSLIQAESGFGKTAMMAELAVTLRDSPRDAPVVVPVFAGVTASSSDLSGMLRSLIWMLDPTPDADTEAKLLNMGYEELRRELHRSMSRAAESRHVVLLVDALDQLNGDALDFTWLGAGIPRRCHVVCTSLPADCAAALRRVGGESLALEPLTREDAGDIVRGVCRGVHKELQQPVVDAVVDKAFSDPSSASPLFISLVVRHLLQLDADDFRSASMQASGRSIRPIDAITSVMLRHIARLPDTCEGLYLRSLARVAEVMGDDCCTYLLLMIAVSRMGLREEDLRGAAHVYVTERPQAAVPDYNAADFAWMRQLLHGDFIQRADMAWDFAHQSFRRTLMRCFGTSAKSYNRQGIVPYMTRRTVEHRADALIDREIMHHLHAADDAREAADMIAYRPRRYGGAPHFTVHLPFLAQITAQEVNEERRDARDTFLLRVVDAFRGRDTRQRYLMAMAFDRFFLGRRPDMRTVPDAFHETLSRAMLDVCEQPPADNFMVVAQALEHCAIGEYAADADTKRRHFERARSLAARCDVQEAANQLGCSINLRSRISQTFGDFLRDQGDAAAGESYLEYLAEVRSVYRDCPDPSRRNGSVLFDYLVGLGRMIQQSIESGAPTSGEAYYREMTTVMSGIAEDVRHPEVMKNLRYYHRLAGEYCFACGRYGDSAPHDRRAMELTLLIHSLWPDLDSDRNTCIALIGSYGHMVNEGQGQIGFLRSHAQEISRVFIATFPALMRTGIRVSGLSQAFVIGGMDPEAIRMARQCE